MEEKLNKRGLNSLILLFIIGISLLFGGGSSGREDAWVCIIIGVFGIIPITRIYTRLLIKYPGKDLYQIFEIVCGKVIGKILIIIYIWFSIHSATLTFLNIVDFINFVGLPSTPIIVILICFALLSIWISKKGVAILGSWSIIFLWIVIFLSIGTIIFLIPLYNIENLKPVLSQGFTPVLNGVISVVTVSFSGLIMFAFLGDAYCCPKEFREIFEKSVLKAGAIIFLLSVQNILVLGVNNNLRAYFPGYECFRRIEIGIAFQRMESIVTMIFIISEFVRANVFILAAIQGVKRLLNLEKGDHLTAPVVMACVNLYFIEYQSIMVGVEYVIEVWPYYSSLFNILIPLGVLLLHYLRGLCGKITNILSERNIMGNRRK